MDQVAQCKVLYLGGYLLMPRVVQEELVPVFAAARQGGAKTVLDVATPGKADYLPRLEKILPHVDDFRPIHNLDSMAELCRALADDSASRDPRMWLRNVA